MTKQHLKRINAPKTWGIQRKKNVFVTKPSPGAHNLSLSIPLMVIIRDILGYAKTKREVIKVLYSNTVKVNSKRVKEIDLPVGIMDTLSFEEIDENYRIMINKKGKLCFNKTKKERTKIRPVKIINKTTMKKKKMQLNFSNGTNLIVDKDKYSVGDSLILEHPHKIVEHIKLEKNAYVYFIKGKHVGEAGNIEKIMKDKIIFKRRDGKKQETSKKYAFVIGKEKPLIVLPE